MVPFKPRREDGRALWRVAYDYVVESITRGELHEGDIIPHDQFAQAMEVKFPSSEYYQAVGKATAEFQKEHARSLIAKRGEGYQVVKGMGMVDKAGQEQESSKRKLDKAIQTITTVDEGDLTSGQVKSVRQLQNGMRFLGQIMGATIDEVEAHREDIEMLKTGRLEDRMRQHATEEEMAEMRRRLADLEKRPVLFVSILGVDWLTHGKARLGADRQGADGTDLEWLGYLSTGRGGQRQSWARRG